MFPQHSLGNHGHTVEKLPSERGGAHKVVMQEPFSQLFYFQANHLIKYSFANQRRTQIYSKNTGVVLGRLVPDGCCH